MDCTVVSALTILDKVISPAIPDGANEVYDYCNQLVDKILYGEITAEDAAKELFEKGNEIMAR